MVNSLSNVSLLDAQERVAAPAARSAVAVKVNSQTPEVQQSATTPRASRVAYSTQDGIDLVRTADAGLSRINESLQRMRELSVQAWSGTVAPEAAMKEIGQLQRNIDRDAAGTRFRNQSLLTSTRTYRVNAGGGERLDVTINRATTRGLGVEGGQIRLGTREEAEASVQRLDQAIEAISRQRGYLGDNVLARLESVPSGAAAQGGGAHQAGEVSRQILQNPNAALTAQGTPRPREGML